MSRDRDQDGSADKSPDRSQVKNRVRGRRPGRPETRALLLEVAGRRFRTDGYQAVTMRSVAEEAGVDVALISYYFGSKRGMFTATLTLPASPFDLLRKALPGDPATLPERIVRTLIQTWDDPERGDPLRMLIATGISDPEFGRLVREVIGREIVDVFAEHFGDAHARQRAAAATVQLSGLIFARYILPLEPIASMPPDELVRIVVPGLRPALLPPDARLRPVP